MKPQTFLEKFEQFAEAPNAVKKLRELALHLEQFTIECNHTI